MSAGLILALSSVIVMLVEAWLAYMDKMFFPSQMMTWYPVGFPLIANGGWWGDLILISAALYFIGEYVAEWSSTEILLTLFVGMTTSYLMHTYVYLPGEFPDALAGGGRPISPAGWVHVMYFGVALAALILFYFCSYPTRNDLIVVGMLLALHIIVANHVPLFFLNKWQHFSWCSDIFVDETTPLRIIGWASALLTTATVIKFYWAPIAAFIVETW